MYKSDFLLKQLEDLLQMIARIVRFRKDLQLENAEKLLQEAYTALNIDKEAILDIDLINGKDIEAETAFFRLELIAELLVEHYWIYNKDVSYLKKAKELLNFVQENGQTFSFEVVQKLEEIENLLSKNADTMIYRAEKPEDEHQIAQIIQTAFKESPHSSHKEHLLVAALRKAKALEISLVAEIENEIVGHIAFSKVKISGSPNVNWYGLAPLAVRPDKQNQGIGKTLVLKGLEILKSIHAEGCVLVGKSSYYQRFGFISNEKLKYEEIPSEYLLALSFNGEIPEGQVFYHPEFSKL